ncbi:expressed protein [Phakopsora pachyrhizi]|uniref:Expressed protein n=1 Tax=Phakopsora pachyrhizi TaxID=170000 RepID=A0AAV0ARP0_PHAPC|nr:expressed protein [Phakopsora pachyrhizi]
MGVSKLFFIWIGLFTISKLSTTLSVSFGKGINPLSLADEGESVLKQFQIFGKNNEVVNVKIVSKFNSDSNSLRFTKRDLLGIEDEKSNEKGNDKVKNQAQNRNYTRVDLTPARPTSETCYSGSFQGPNQSDCDVIFYAQKYNSYGSLTAFPGAKAEQIKNRCLRDEEQSIGGSFLFENYLGYTFQNV